MNTIIDVAVIFPAHAGHEIVYSELGWSDFRLTTMLTGADMYEIGDIEPRSGGEITESEIWCATCGASLDWPEVTEEEA